MTDLSKASHGGKVYGKVAIVTGAGSGIGRAAALLLAREGACICLVDLKDERTEQVYREIEAAGGEAIVADTNVSDPARVGAAVKAAADRWGRVDIVFANAGINGTLAPIESMEPEDWDETLNTNLKGTFLTVKYAVPYLKKQGGSVIITSSINGNRTFTGMGMSAYATSKAGQVAFMQMAALELARYRIRVNAICPGSIETNISENTHPTPELKEVKIRIEYPDGSQPLEHKSGEPEQVAELVLFLASDASSHITGTPIYIDGAESLLR
ncbi:SDR family oxidoreductase [Paenibacillus koleovorans]|uniref:SDR family oxidoreductase n=1 Tax=Paenibacillus koleovorans TaxID=121608 RepID=UPI000FDB0AC2|nr:SDR family NAD(P)-dependent oxidoreductase [Paenibacillus koleovorans]